jgi:hypothetical protein
MSRRKKEYRTNSRENYDRFLKENNLKESDLSFTKYCKNLEVCNWMFIEYALRTGSKVYLPYGFGPLAVNKKMLKRFKEFKDKDGNLKKVVNLRVNWAKTKELGKKVYHTNEHSDGYNFRWIWFPEESKLHLSDLYVFRAARYPSRAINKYVRRTGNFKELYLEWTKNTYKI